MIQLQGLQNKNRKVTLCTIYRFQPLKAYCTASSYHTDVYLFAFGKMTAEMNRWALLVPPNDYFVSKHRMEEAGLLRHQPPKDFFLMTFGYLLVTPAFCL